MKKFNWKWLCKIIGHNKKLYVGIDFDKDIDTQSWIVMDAVDVV